jgi:hypothetical protein
MQRVYECKEVFLGGGRQEEIFWVEKKKTFRH